MSTTTQPRGSLNLTVVTVAGLLLAVLAEACSVGLVGLSGWFIASSAIAGATAYSVFSYLAPSGGVRAFAVGRIATNYANRVVLHSAALRRISAARLKYYDRAAADPSQHGTWSGQSLDRVMTDADTAGMALIQATAPLVVAGALTAGGCAVIVLAGYPAVAVVLAVAAAVCAALAIVAARRMDDGSRTRSALRVELVTAIEAWPEMASLGATDELAHRTLRQLATFEDHRFRYALTIARIRRAARAVTAIALLVTVVAASQRGAAVSTLVFLALLVAGVLVNAERLVDATQAWAVARQAGRRLAAGVSAETSASAETAVPPADPPAPRPLGPTLRATYGRHGLTVSDYPLPAASTWTERRIDVAAVAGRTVVVTGASGSGKTTLLDAIAAELRQPANLHEPGVVTSVAADDYLFTGTVATNIRLADPAASDDKIADLLAGMLLDRSGIEPSTRIGVGGRNLSGGEQRRLHLARAVATQPDVLLIDEPTTGLDASTATAVLRAVRHRLPHTVLVLAMHELPEDPAALGPGWSTLSLA